MIKLRDLSKIYDDGQEKIYALNRINLQIDRGEFVAIMGPSGCGKSTLLNLICGLDFPTKGQTFLDGVEISGLSDDERTLFRREQVGIIFQFFNLLPNLTSWENVALPLLLAGHTRTALTGQIENVFHQVGLKGRENNFPYQLSGGQMQRVAIARTIIRAPQIILADEPTGNLDSKNGSEILMLLKSLSREQGRTVLMATHSQDAANMADRIIFMKDGTINQPAKGNHSSSNSGD